MGMPIRVVSFGYAQVMIIRLYSLFVPIPAKNEGNEVKQQQYIFEV